MSIDLTNRAFGVTIRQFCTFEIGEKMALSPTASECSIDALVRRLNRSGRHYLFIKMAEMTELKTSELEGVILDARKYLAKRELGIIEESPDEGLKNLCEVLQTQGVARRDMPKTMGVVRLYGCAFEEWPKVRVYFDNLKDIDAWTNWDYEHLPGSKLADEIREALTQRMDATTVDSIITGFSKDTKPTRRQVQMLQEACGVLPPIFAHPQIWARVGRLGKRLCDLRLWSAEGKGDFSQDMQLIETKLSRYAEYPFKAAPYVGLYLGRDSDWRLGDLPEGISLTSRVYNALCRAGICTIQGLIDWREEDPELEDLLFISNFDSAQYQEVLRLLRYLGH